MLDHYLKRTASTPRFQASVGVVCPFQPLWDGTGAIARRRRAT
jgi:hypothetical protein